MTTKNIAEEIAYELQQISNITANLSHKVVIAHGARILRTISAMEAEIDVLKAEIESLKSGGEPVAFMNAHGSCLSVKALEGVDGVLGFDRPLYDRPAKTLTDEKIQDLMVESGFIRHDFYSVKIFVEAILKKAREHE